MPGVHYGCGWVLPWPFFLMSAWFCPEDSGQNLSQTPGGVTCQKASRQMGGRITALKVQKRNRQRVNVYIDNRFAFGLAAIEAIQLKVDQVLNDAEILRLKNKDQVESAHERALNFLSYRPRSIAEVHRYLSEKQFDTPTIDQIITRLSQAGLLDDEAFAHYWLENRDTFKPRASRALRYELGQKGIATVIIDDLLADYDENDAAYRAALPQAQKLARKHNIDTFRSKLLAFLKRRGFSFDVAHDAVNRLLAELSEKGVDT
jgi:regulatory protein